MPNTFDEIKKSHDNMTGYYGQLFSASKKFRKGRKSGSIAKSAKENLFEFPVFVSNTVPIDMATAANDLLCQLYLSYITMAVSSEPTLTHSEVKNHAQFAKWKTDTNKYLEYVDWLELDFVKDACHSEYVYDGYTVSCDMMSLPESEIKILNEWLDYQPLSEFNHFFQEANNYLEKTSDAHKYFSLYVRETRDGEDYDENDPNTYDEGVELFDASDEDSIHNLALNINNNERYHYSIDSGERFRAISRPPSAAQMNSMSVTVFDLDEYDFDGLNNEIMQEKQVKADAASFDEIMKKASDAKEFNNFIKSKKGAQILHAYGIKPPEKDVSPETILSMIRLQSDSGHIELQKKQIQQLDNQLKTANFEKISKIARSKKDTADALEAVDKNKAREWVRDNIASAENLKDLRDSLKDATGVEIKSGKDLYAALDVLEKADLITKAQTNKTLSNIRKYEEKIKSVEASDEMLDAYKKIKQAEVRKSEADAREREAMTTNFMLKVSKAGKIAQTANSAVGAVRGAIGIVSDVQNIQLNREKLKMAKKQNENYDEDRAIANAEKIQKIKSAQTVDTAKITDETKLQKLNTIKPYTASVQFNVFADDGTATKVNYMCGVKTHCRIIDASILPEVAEYPLKEMDKLARKAKWRAGELKFLKDIVFNIKEKKQSAADDRDPKRKWYRRLYTLAHIKGDAAAAEVIQGKSLFNSYFKDKIDESDMSRGVIPNVSMIVTQSDIDNIKARTGIDLGKGGKAKNFCNELFLMCFMIIDTDTESFKYIVPDLHNDFETHSLASVNKLMAQLDTAGTKTRDMFKLLG